MMRVPQQPPTNKSSRANSPHNHQRRVTDTRLLLDSANMDGFLLIHNTLPASAGFKVTELDVLHELLVFDDCEVIVSVFHAVSWKWWKTYLYETSCS